MLWDGSLLLVVHFYKMYCSKGFSTSVYVHFVLGVVGVVKYF